MNRWIRNLNILNLSMCAETPADGYAAVGLRYLFQRALQPLIVDWNSYDTANTFEDLGPGACRSSDETTISDECERQHRCFDLLLICGPVNPKLNELKALLVERQSVPKFLVWAGAVSEESFHQVQAIGGSLTKTLLILTHRPQPSALSVSRIDTQVLPCPSLFVSNLEVPSRRLRTVGFVGHSRGDCQPEVAAQMSQLATLVNHIYPVVVLPDGVPDDIEDFFGTALVACDVIITNNFGDAVVANSLLKPAILMTSNPKTLLPRADLFPFIFQIPYSQILPALYSLNLDRIGRALLNWKRLVEEQYLLLLTSRPEQYGFDTF